LIALGVSTSVVQQIQGLAANLLIGILIIIVLFVRPQGLLPEKPVRTPIWVVFEERMGYLPKNVKSLYMVLVKSVTRVAGGRRGKRSSQSR